jgi:hypothetical protein
MDACERNERHQKFMALCILSLILGGILLSLGIGLENESTKLVPNIQPINFSQTPIFGLFWVFAPMLLSIAGVLFFACGVCGLISFVLGC